MLPVLTLLVQEYHVVSANSHAFLGVLTILGLYWEEVRRYQVEGSVEFVFGQSPRPATSEASQPAPRSSPVSLVWSLDTAIESYLWVEFSVTSVIKPSM